MESLENLGVDTPYGQGGRPLLVDPATEAEFQLACSPISNWQFTLGTDYKSRAVSGVWGSLSIVTGPFSPTIVTEANVPLLSDKGQDTGHTIAGATTIPLTDEQSKLAAQSSKLWIQGGTPTQPITDPVTYGFGALRCATDNLNGDNVEWISYPPDGTHVFCFAYYVKPAPTSGTIIVRKEVSGLGSDEPQKFRFTGNVSFAPGGEFFLTASSDERGLAVVHPCRRRDVDVPRAHPRVHRADGHHLRVGEQDEQDHARPRNGRGLGRAGSEGHRHVHVQEHVAAAGQARDPQDHAGRHRLVRLRHQG